MYGNENRQLLEKIRELQEFLRQRPDIKPQVVELVESYRICRQRSHGDVPPDITRGALFEEMYQHVYGGSGCRWCQDRITKLERHKLSQSARLIDRIVKSVEAGWTGDQE
jgi:hypothetical protein